MSRKDIMEFKSQGIDPIRFAKDAATIAMDAGTPVYWKHEDEFRFLVQPGMTCEEVADIVRGDDQQFVEAIPVLWTGDEDEDRLGLLRKLDNLLKEHDLGSIIQCCDIREGICGGDCDQPYQFPDGTYAVALYSSIERKVKAVLEHISHIPQLVVVNMTTNRMVLAEAAHP